MKVYLQILIILLFIGGCGISQGGKRDKLQYLYKMSTQASTLNEFSGETGNYKMLDLYRDRLNKMEKDVKDFPAVKEWERSVTIKNEFLTVIAKNKQATDSLLKKDSLKNVPINESIPQIQEIRIRAGEFVNLLQNEITAVDRE